MLQLDRQLLICFFAAVCCIYRRCWFHCHPHMVDLIRCNAAWSPLFWMENKLRRERFKAIPKYSSCAAVIVFMCLHVNALTLPCMLCVSYIFIFCFGILERCLPLYSRVKNLCYIFLFSCVYFMILYILIIFPCNPFG